MMNLLDCSYGTTAGLFSILAVFTAILIHWEYPPKLTYTSPRMEHDMKTLEENFRQKNKSCFILGASGETGRALLKEIVNRKIFSRITLIGRRQLTFEEKAYKSLVQQVVDFEKLDDYAAAFQGHDVGYCCLGTSLATARTEGYSRVDHDYVLKSAQLAKARGCSHFHLLSARKANKSSGVHYLKVKGEAEADVMELGFERFSIYRLGLLLVDRKEFRLADWLAQRFLEHVSVIFPTAISIPITWVARAMVVLTLLESKEKVDILLHRDMYNLAQAAES